MLHQKEVTKYNGSLADLAEDIGDLGYDALAVFLGLLQEKIKSDGDTDFNRDRVQLAKQLYGCAEQLGASQQSITKAWIISKPYMKEVDL